MKLGVYLRPFTRFGHVEVLYVTEFVGLCLIAAGYRLSVGPVSGRLGRWVAGPQVSIARRAEDPSGCVPDRSLGAES